MKKIDSIEIHQTLHGYSDGHQLISSSVNLSSQSERVMAILSDLSGSEIDNNFTEYYTGYFLYEEKYYVLSKTWYANEMKRPGCVWTHSLLIKELDLQVLQYFGLVGSLFTRPKNTFEEYNNSIFFDKQKCDNETVDYEKLRFVVWSMYNFSQPVIISAKKESLFSNEILYLWQLFAGDFLKYFTFCTGSLSGRKIYDISFDLQVVPENLARGIARSVDNCKLIDTVDDENRIQKWIDTFALKITQFDTDNLVSFYSVCFGFSKERKLNYSEYLQFALESQIITKSAELDKVLTISNNIFNDDNKTFFYKSIIVAILEKKISNYFFNATDLSLIIELCKEPMFVNEQELSQDHISFQCVEKNYTFISDLISLQWINEIDETKNLLHTLIRNDINNIGKSILYSFSQLIPYHNLPKYSDMDLVICCVLIKLNPEFCLCTDLWKQDFSFQVEIINNINLPKKSDKLLSKIIMTIISNSSFDLKYNIYKVFNDRGIISVLDYCVHNRKNISRVTYYNYLRISQYNYFISCKWLIHNYALIDIHDSVFIFSECDPYMKEFRKITIAEWTQLFSSGNLSTLSPEESFSLAVFLLPLILLADETFPVFLVTFSYREIYEQLANQTLDFKYWYKLDFLLPQLSWDKNWDKCKRLKKGLLKKGYIL